MPWFQTAVASSLHSRRNDVCRRVAMMYAVGSPFHSKPTGSSKSFFRTDSISRVVHNQANFTLRGVCNGLSTCNRLSDGVLRNDTLILTKKQYSSRSLTQSVFVRY